MATVKKTYRREEDNSILDDARQRLRKAERDGVDTPIAKVLGPCLLWR